MKFYRIWDTEKEEYFKTDRGKTIWTGVGPAKNAWNTAQGYRKLQEHGKFDEQEHLRMVPCVCIPEDDWHQTQSNARSYFALRTSGVC